MEVGEDGGVGGGVEEEAVWGGEEGTRAESVWAFLDVVVMVMETAGI